MVNAQQVQYRADEKLFKIREEEEEDGATGADAFFDDDSIHERDALLSGSQAKIFDLPSHPKSSSISNPLSPKRISSIASRSRRSSVSSDIQYIHEIRKELDESDIKPSSIFKIFKMNQVIIFLMHILKCMTS
jgi:hypothetical protein